MRRAVLITRQAIAPRFAIRIRLNMCLFTCNLWAGSSQADLDDESGDRVADSRLCRERRARPDSAEKCRTFSCRGVYALFSRYLAGTSGGLSQLPLHRTGPRLILNSASRVSPIAADFGHFQPNTPIISRGGRFQSSRRATPRAPA